MTVLDRRAPAAPDDVPATPPATRGHAAALGIGAVIAVGVVVRFWAPSALWLDEAISVDIARLPLSDIPDALRQDGHPPLYYVLLHGWMALFGTGDVAVRSLSAVASIATLPVVWALGRRLGGRPTAAVAVVLLATSPFALRYASEARMYALVTLIAATGHLLVLRAAESPRPGRLALVAVTTTALLLTHYWGAWMVAAGVILVGTMAWRDRGARARGARARWARVGAAIVVGCLPALAWLPAAAYQATHTGTPWARSVEPFDAGFDTLLDLGGGKWVAGRVAAPMLAAAIIVALVAIPVSRWRMDVDLRTVPGARVEAALAGLTMLLGLGAAVATDSAFQSRYAAVVLPAVLLVVAVGVTRLPHPWIRAAVVATLVVAGLASAAREGLTPRTQGGEVAMALDASARPGDVVAFCPDQLRPSVARRLDDRGLVLSSFPSGSPPGRIDWVDYTERIDDASVEDAVDDALETAGAEGRVWLVWQEGYRGFDEDCEAIRRGLEGARGPGVEVVERDADSYERHILERFDPR